MNVFEQDGVFKASRISGPKHNYLGIVFSDKETDVQIVEKHIADDGEDVGRVEGNEVIQVVKDAVWTEASDCGRQVYVAAIEFVPTDTADLQAYIELARAITRFALQSRGCVPR